MSASVGAMMAKKLKVEDLIRSTELAVIENEIAQATGYRVLRDHISKSCSFAVSDLEAAEVTVADCFALLREHRNLISRFGIAFLKSQSPTNEIEDEYPDGEEPDPEERARVVETLGLGTGFGISYAIRIGKLKDSAKDALLTFLKRRRIPGAAKFASELKRVFKSVSK